MKSFLNRTFIALLVLVSIVAVVFVSCSDDDDNPVSSSDVSWKTYDNFNDDTADTDLWTYNIAFGGQVLDSMGQMQVWGNTDSWTGSGMAITTKAKLGWKFTLTETYFEEGGGCQGWSVQALDPTGNVSVEFLNRLTAGCGNDMGDSVGVYEITHAGDSLGVYKDGTLLRRFYADNITYFKLRFYDTNVFGDGTHSHIFVDDIVGLEWDNWTP